MNNYIEQAQKLVQDESAWWREKATNTMNKQLADAEKAFAEGRAQLVATLQEQGSMLFELTRHGAEVLERQFTLFRNLFELSAV